MWEHTVASIPPLTTTISSTGSTDSQYWKLSAGMRYWNTLLQGRKLKKKEIMELCSILETEEKTWALFWNGKYEFEKQGPA